MAVLIPCRSERMFLHRIEKVHLAVFIGVDLVHCFICVCVCVFDTVFALGLNSLSRVWIIRAGLSVSVFLRLAAD